MHTKYFLNALIIVHFLYVHVHCKKYLINDLCFQINNFHIHVHHILFYS